MENRTLGKRRPAVSEEMEVETADAVEKEIDELRREITDLAQRILDARRTIPGRLLQALSSRLLAQRPILPLQTLTPNVASEVSEQSEVDGGSDLSCADQRFHEKLGALRDKTESNICALPVILKRANDCLLRIENLNDYDVNRIYACLNEIIFHSEHGFAQKQCDTALWIY